MSARATFDEVLARALYEEGKSCNAIARRLGVAPSTVSRWAKREGLSFARSQTAAANEAHAIDLKSRRQDIVQRLYRRAATNMDRLEAPTFKTLTRDFGGGESPDELNFVPTVNERELTGAIATGLAAAAKLEAIDADNGASDARSMLAELGRALGIGTVDE